MRKILTAKRIAKTFAVCMLAVFMTSCNDIKPDPQSSPEFAKKLKTGWNLGNTLDAYNDDNDKEWGQNLNSESCWGMPRTTEDMIRSVKNKGFSSIRIPVSWHNHIYDSTNYTIDPEWMKRVKQIVEWAYDQDMYIILNMHHDNLGTADYGKTAYGGRKVVGYIIDSSYTDVSKAYIGKVWRQIAEAFKNYDEHLIFEVLNEPRCVGTGCEWWVGDDTAVTAEEANAIITSYEQEGINSIRSTGGRNADRYIMVPAYAGSSSAISTYKLPKDSAQDKLLFSFHAYSPYNFAMSGDDKTFDQDDKNSLTAMFNEVRTKFPNIGIVLGETSATNKGNTDDRNAWSKFFFETAYRNYNMSVLLWDNMVFGPDETGNDGERHGYFARNELIWKNGTMIENMINATK